MSLERLQELAALKVLGVLSNDELQELSELLSKDGAPAAREMAAFHNLASVLALGQKPVQPPPSLRERILEEIGSAPKPPPAHPSLPELISGFLFLGQNQMGDWRPLPVPGAWHKILWAHPGSEYAIVLGKLDAGARYPAHTHIGPEDVYMLSGDLHMGDYVLHAGDFHHADPGTSHGENFSETGCTLLLVLSTRDLQRQYALQPP